MDGDVTKCVEAVEARFGTLIDRQQDGSFHAVAGGIQTVVLRFDVATGMATIVTPISPAARTLPKGVLHRLLAHAATRASTGAVLAPRPATGVLDLVEVLPLAGIKPRRFAERALAQAATAIRLDRGAVAFIDRQSAAG